MVTTNFSYGRVATRAAAMISAAIILSFFVRLLLGAKLFTILQESQLSLWRFNVRFSAILCFGSLIGISLSAIGVFFAQRRFGPFVSLFCSILCFIFVLFIFLNSTSLRNMSVNIAAENAPYWNTSFSYPPVP